MAKLTKKDLESLTSEEIRSFLLNNNSWVNIPVIKNYVEEVQGNYSISNRINRVNNLLNIIIVQRFLNNNL